MGSYFLIRFFINDAFIVLVYFPLLWKTECIGFFHRDGCNSRCSPVFDIAREWLVCFGGGGVAPLWCKTSRSFMRVSILCSLGYPPSSSEHSKWDKCPPTVHWGGYRVLGCPNWAGRGGRDGDQALGCPTSAWGEGRFSFLFQRKRRSFQMGDGMVCMMFRFWVPFPCGFPVSSWGMLVPVRWSLWVRGWGVCVGYVCVQKRSGWILPMFRR